MLFTQDERTELFDRNYSSPERVIVNQGGTSSGKTYAIMQVLFQLAFNKPNQVCTVVGQDIPNLKVGAYRDAKTIIGNYEIMPEAFPAINEGERIIKCKNGSIIEFKSYADAQDAKSGKRDYLFINEANGISYQIYWQLAIRTRKKIFIDYNPSARFWVHDEVIGREGVRVIYSWYEHNCTARSAYEAAKKKDNSLKVYFLSDEERSRIENIADPELHKVYARGKTGKIEGLVLTNWDIVDTLPPEYEWKMSAFGLDFGFTCFKGDTLIMTSEGEKPIKDVCDGDYVLTRKGYQRVKRNIYNGYKKVIHKKFVKDLHMWDIFCTFEHNFNANGKWKKYGKLTAKDNLFMLSSSMAWSIADTQVANTEIITTTSGKKTGNIIQRCCTMQFLRKLTDLYPMAWLYITRISTRLTMTSAIWLCLLLLNICRFIEGLRNGQRNILKNIAEKYILKRIGTSAEKRYLKTSQKSVECANGVVRSLHPQTPINDSAENPAIINGNIKHLKTISKWCASIVARLSSAISILNRNVAAMSVRINYQSLSALEFVNEEWCDVYDLEIENVHEYFANGVLVHNCDPTALEHVVLAHGDLWVDELVYSTNLTNPDIANRAKYNGLDSTQQIIADSAEPKSIRELQAHGLWVTASVKGNDSIVAGLDILRRYRLHVTRRSSGIISNLKAYRWGKDKDGNDTNKPEDKNNHGIDAIRYVALVKLPKHREVRGVRRRN